MQIYARLFRPARIALGWSQDELCALSGVGRSTLYRLERGKRTGVRLYTLLAVQKALEEGGIVFLPGDETHGPGIRVPKGLGDDDPSTWESG